MTLAPHPVRIRLGVCETHPARRSVLIYALFTSSGFLRSDPLILARPDSRKQFLVPLFSWRGATLFFSLLLLKAGTIPRCHFL